MARRSRAWTPLTINPEQKERLLALCGTGSGRKKTLVDTFATEAPKDCIEYVASVNSFQKRVNDF